VIYEETYAAGSDDGINQAWGRNMRVTRTGVGAWTASFATPHPDGTRYAASILTEEQVANSDPILPYIDQGTKTASGFNFHLVTGDNGLAADPPVDTPFTVSIDGPVTVLVP